MTEEASRQESIAREKAIEKTVEGEGGSCAGVVGAKGEDGARNRVSLIIIVMMMIMMMMMTMMMMMMMMMMSWLKVLV